MVRQQPHRRWKMQEHLSSQDGGMNAGISIVRDAETGKISIEKRFGRAEIEARIADNEIKALLHLKGHTHIPKMVDYFFDPFRMQGAIYLEYCKFGGMDQLIERHAMQRRTICEHHIWKWFIQLADALTLCHYGPNPQDLQARANWNWVIHRDIKPANCFLARGKKGTPSAGQVIAKLGDWGCGVTKQAMTSRFKDPTNMSTGTEAFMAPEQPRYYARSDVWQLGAVMFCLCTLTQCPAEAKRSLHRAGHYTKELGDAIWKCMAHDRDARPKADDLVNLLNTSYHRIVGGLPRDGDLILPPGLGRQGGRRRRF